MDEEERSESAAVYVDDRTAASVPLTTWQISIGFTYSRDVEEAIYGTGETFSAG